MNLRLPDGFSQKNGQEQMNSGKSNANMGGKKGFCQDAYLSPLAVIALSFGYDLPVGVDHLKVAGKALLGPREGAEQHGSQ